MSKRGRLLIVALGMVQACAEAGTTTVPSAAPSPAAQAVLRPQRCGMAHRAQRTWVGFGDDMTSNDVERAAEAAQAVVHAIDEALCALLVRPVNATTEQRPLLAAIEAGATLEITRIVLNGANISNATAEMHPTPGASPRSWLARLQIREQRWRVTAFDPAPAP